MKKTVRIVSYVVGLVVLAGAAVFVWATVRVSGLRSAVVEAHSVDFPVPFPLTAQEQATLPASADPMSVALERAIERGGHLVGARYGCTECHGVDFGGGVMVDDPLLGRLLGPNITSGSGSKALDYDASDWDRAVRHGLTADGTRSFMPSVDFQMMSDQELSDVIAYIGSLPPVDAEVSEVALGPVGRVLVATGELPFSADLIGTHGAAHTVLPPRAAVTVDFGRHLAAVCSGCHSQDLAGGPVVGGDPGWPPAANLTPHVDGLAGWTLTDFRRVLLDGTKPDGTSVLAPMDALTPFAANMTEVEMEALWTYLESLPPVATPE